VDAVDHFKVRGVKHIVAFVEILLAQAVWRSGEATHSGTTDVGQEFGEHPGLVLWVQHVALVEDHILEVAKVIRLILDATDGGIGELADLLAANAGRVDPGIDVRVVAHQLGVVLLQDLFRWL
jgi:hypothetical protein